MRYGAGANGGLAAAERWPDGSGAGAGGATALGSGVTVYQAPQDGHLPLDPTARAGAWAERRQYGHRVRMDILHRHAARGGAYRDAAHDSNRAGQRGNNLSHIVVPKLSRWRMPSARALPRV